MESFHFSNPFLMEFFPCSTFFLPVGAQSDDMITPSFFTQLLLAFFNFQTAPFLTFFGQIFHILHCFAIFHAEIVMHDVMIVIIFTSRAWLMIFTPLRFALWLLSI